MGRGAASERPRTSKLATALVLPCVLGCAQIAGTDEYRVRVTPKQEPPPPPFLTGSADCEACAADKCGAQLTACDADEVCSSWLADLRARPDPLAAYERYKIENDLQWDYYHQGQARSYEAIYYLMKCAEECADVCPIGQNFTCVGDFEWDLPQPKVLRTSVSEPATVTACLDADQCEASLSFAKTDEAGFADLRFASDESQRGPVGYLQVVKDDQDSLPWRYVETRPFSDNDYLSLALIKDDVFRSWYKSFGLSFDDGGLGLVMVRPVDCSGVPAAQVSLEAWSYTGAQPKSCEDCFYAYADVTNTPSAQLTAFPVPGHAGYIANVPPGVVYVVLRRVAEPRDVVSVAHLVVRGNEVTFVRLYPATKQVLRSFPDPKN